MTVEGAAFAFERAVVLKNPVSTRAGRSGTEAQIADIQQAFPKGFTVLETSPESAQTIDTLWSKLEEGDVLCIAGGDGTIRDAVEATSAEDYDKEIPLLPLWCGNANDLAVALNGKKYKRTPSTVLKEGRIASILPIRADITQANGKREKHIAANCMGIGASALLSAMLNERGHREKTGHEFKPVRSIREVLMLGKAIGNAEPFVLQITGEEPAKLVDISIANGPRMGKYGKPPIKLEDTRFFISSVSDTRLRTAAKWCTRMITGIADPNSNYIEQGEEPETLRFLTPTMMQFDGEAAHYPAQTSLQISHHSRPFYALTTKTPSP